MQVNAYSSQVGLTISGLNAVAHHLEKGIDNGDVERQSLALFLRSAAAQLEARQDGFIEASLLGVNSYCFITRVFLNATLGDLRAMEQDLNVPRCSMEEPGVYQLRPHRERAERDPKTGDIITPARWRFDVLQYRNTLGS